jgi:hypothetical protein
LIIYFYTCIIPFNQHVCYCVDGESHIALLSTSFCSVCLCSSSLVVETLHYSMENVNNIYLLFLLACDGTQYAVLFYIVFQSIFFTFDGELLFRKNGRLRAKVRFRLITFPFHHLRRPVISKRILSRLTYILDFPPSSRISFAVIVEISVHRSYISGEIDVYHSAPYVYLY